MISYHSTKDPNHHVSFRDAVLQGLAPDNGLFMPDAIPAFPAAFFSSLREASFSNLAAELAQRWTEGVFAPSTVRDLTARAFPFDTPVIALGDRLFAHELFHGPTLSFKDFGARFLAQVIRELTDESIVVLVATSGDTGSAVASAFLNVPGTRVVLLYPKNGVSHIQEQQLTTMGGNVDALEVRGTFDDCQRMVKAAFLDPEISARRRLTSANSINIARLLPQSFYYVRAWSQIPDEAPAVFSVPSGNLGNLTSGILAKRMGLPIEHFVAAVNRNGVLPRYLRSGEFVPAASVRTLSNAMDVGNPSNFARLFEIFHGDPAEMRTDISSESVTDEETLAAMREVFERYGKILDPHGAVAFAGLKRYLAQRFRSRLAVFLETAHPAKFQDIVTPIAGGEIPTPERLAACLARRKQSIEIPAEDGALRDFLLSQRA